MMPTLRPRADRRPQAALVLGLAALAAWLWIRRPPADEILAKAGPTPVPKASLKARAGPGSLFTPARDEESEPDSAPFLTFDRLKRLLDRRDPLAAQAFVEAADPAADPHAPGSEPARQARERPHFVSYLESLATSSPGEARSVARGLLKEPPTSESLREAILERERRLAPASRLLVRPGGLGALPPSGPSSRQGVASRPSRPGGAFAGEAASSRGLSFTTSNSAARPGAGEAPQERSGPSTHDVDAKLAKLKSSGPDVDAIKFLESMFASFPKATREKLVDVCYDQGVCEFVQACLTAKVYDQCLEACRTNPKCVFPAPGNPEPGAPEAGCGSAIPDSTQAAGPAAAGEGTVCVESNSQRGYFVVGPNQSWGWNGSKCWSGHMAGVYSVNTNGGYGYPPEQQAVVSPARRTLAANGTITFGVHFCQPELGNAQ